MSRAVRPSDWESWTQAREVVRVKCSRVTEKALSAIRVAAMGKEGAGQEESDCGRASDESL
jgi:hypothetical protein